MPQLAAKLVHWQKNINFINVNNIRIALTRKITGIFHLKICMLVDLLMESPRRGLEGLSPLQLPKRADLLFST